MDIKFTTRRANKILKHNLPKVARCSFSFKAKKMQLLCVHSKNCCLYLYWNALHIPSSLLNKTNPITARTKAISSLATKSLEAMQQLHNLSNFRSTLKVELQILQSARQQEKLRTLDVHMHLISVKAKKNKILRSIV